jgi:hypothetical protein
MSASAASLTFTAAVAPRAVRTRARTGVRAAAGRARVTSAAVEKINVNDVKDHLDRGFVLVDIRDPEECAETGYKSSWKNIVVRTRTSPRLHPPSPPPARNHGNAKNLEPSEPPISAIWQTDRARSRPFGIPVGSTGTAPFYR